MFDLVHRQWRIGGYRLPFPWCNYNYETKWSLQSCAKEELSPGQYGGTTTKEAEGKLDPQLFSKNARQIAANVIDYNEY